MNDSTCPISLSVYADRETGNASIDVLVWEENRREWLRDWFAGLALQGFLSEPMQEQRIPFMYMTAKEKAECCYEMADAMLSARSGGREGGER